MSVYVDAQHKAAVKKRKKDKIELSAVQLHLENIEMYRLIDNVYYFEVWSTAKVEKNVMVII